VQRREAVGEWPGQGSVPANFCRHHRYSKERGQVGAVCLQVLAVADQTATCASIEDAPREEAVAVVACICIRVSSARYHIEQKAG
jgi:hypothetical protein